QVSDFSILVAESQMTGVDWDIVFVSALAGRSGFPPNSDEATQPLTVMTKKIKSGMINEFLTFNRNGELVTLY
ncbi:ribonucleotide reductase subunit alpha, partial [Alteromonas sp. 14N.309.X.WAT.G.H12]